MAEARQRLRCAIYTRKSSEEGLEQSFNSLDAQREACAAYIASQRHEGWRAIDARYDDGGYSGGTTERPGLQRLLTDIGNRKVDVVVVYKVDRLTRSLSDFARIIEVFDAQGVSFVSVTQQFNTTSSMGRLTLNVLLSFAQFEREVTGERIRDKIAASKKKGMWMGGNVPLGYDLEDRKLVVNRREAGVVQDIFKRYLKLGSILKLRDGLRAAGVTSKRRIAKSGTPSGGVAYSRGALYHILRCRIYIGEIPHKGNCYPGEHEAIIQRDLWDKVHALLQTNGDARRNGLTAKSPSLLAGLLYDEDGHCFTPSHTTKKNGKRYRYYGSQAVIQNGPGAAKGLSRIPAHEIEELVCRRIQALLGAPEELLKALGAPQDVHLQIKRKAREFSRRWPNLSPSELRTFLRSAVSRITVHDDAIDIGLLKPGLLAALLDYASSKTQGPREGNGETADRLLKLRVNAVLKRVGNEKRIVAPDEYSQESNPRPDASLIKAVARARLWFEMLTSGKTRSLRAIAKAGELDERYLSRVLRLAFVDPDTVKRIAEGTQGPGVTLDALLKNVPIIWNGPQPSAMKLR